jgi:hypothetical protein
VTDAKNNTGYRNTGNYNTGNYNTGYHNTGNYNTGDRNTGDYNTGNYNTGYRNTGYRNTGNYNTGDYNTGFFCIQTPSPVFFDKVTNLTWDEARALIPYVELPVGCEWVYPDKMTDAEKMNNPKHVTTGGFLRVLHTSVRTAFPLAWAKLTAETKRKFLALPNFDADKFLACTGVDVRLDADLFPPAKSPPAVTVEAVPSEVVVNGRTYTLKV